MQGVTSADWVHEKLWIAFVATMLWHWEHRTLTFGMFNSRAFC